MIKATSALWEKHLKRMDNIEMRKRVRNVKIEACSRAGRKPRWMNGVDEYPSFWGSKDGRQGYRVVEEASA
jgi:hypothetical protein